MSPIAVSICLPSHLVHFGALNLACCSNSLSTAEDKPIAALRLGVSDTRSVLAAGEFKVGNGVPGGIKNVRGERYSMRKSTASDLSGAAVPLLISCTDTCWPDLVAIKRLD